MSGSLPGVTTPSSSSNSAASASATALSSLSSNFQNFLGLLMTQLQNQDPTQPMDANQFTNELVEFSNVEQQISTNGNLSQLITLTQSGQDLQAASIVGHQVQVASPNLSLQNGSGGIQFTSPTSQPVTITVSDSNGHPMATQTIAATQGTNTWSWNGAGPGGITQPDGSYAVSVSTAGDSPESVPFTVLGQVTGVQTTSGNMQLVLGSVTVPVSSLQSIVK